jgi:hypothetical protein
VTKESKWDKPAELDEYERANKKASPKEEPMVVAEFSADKSSDSIEHAIKATLADIELPSETMMSNPKTK